MITNQMNCKSICSFVLFTFWVNSAIVFLAHRLLPLSALQFVLMVHYYAALRLAWVKRRRTLNATQLQFLGS